MRVDNARVHVPVDKYEANLVEMIAKEVRPLLDAEEK